MMLILFFFILISIQVHGKFLSNPDSSSFIVLRHIRLTTNDEQYRIRCPYNLNHLTLQLLNYSNENCFNLYSTSNHNACTNHHSPCQFHAKSVQLHCDHHSYSNHVDITYHCSYKSIISPFTFPALPFPTNTSDLEESITLFLIGLCTIILLWILICCIWVIHSHQNNEKHRQLLAHRSYPKDDIINLNLSSTMDNLRLHTNPLENNHILSLRTTQTV